MCLPQTSARCQKNLHIFKSRSKLFPARRAFKASWKISSLSSGLQMWKHDEYQRVRTEHPWQYYVVSRVPEPPIMHEPIWPSVVGKAFLPVAYQTPLEPDQLWGLEQLSVKPISVTISRRWTYSKRSMGCHNPSDCLQYLTLPSKSDGKAQHRP